MGNALLRGMFGNRARWGWLVGLALGGLSAAGCADEPGSGDGDQDTTRVLTSAVQSPQEAARMSNYLASRYDAADVVHSFVQPSGDAVDCVRLERQPGLRGARAAIATPPKAAAAGNAPAAGEGLEAFVAAGQRDAKGAARACPAGSVPIRRVTADDLARFKSLDGRMRKHPDDKPGVEPPRLGPTSLHQYAVVTQSGLANQGAHGRINIWNPYVESASEFSLSQIWVTRGFGANLQTLEAGWQKYPNLYGTWLPHLFIYSTSDGYGPAGCYNLDCGRFVQVDGRVIIGGALPGSIFGSSQYELETSFLLWQGNWWLGINGIWVGYYPGGLFNAAGLSNGADRIDFGGEIIDDRGAHPGRHTMTAMGSGLFPASWWLYAAYDRDIWYWTDPGHAYYMTGLSTFRSDAFCYDISLYVTADPTWNTFLFMGGPGYNANCM